MNDDDKEQEEPIGLDKLSGAAAPPAAGMDADVLIRLLGERDLEVLVLRQKVAELEKQVEGLSQQFIRLAQLRRQRTEESDTPSR